MSITPLPTPVPSKSDPANFDQRADAFLEALPGFATEANALAVTVNGYKDDAEQAVIDAQEQVTLAVAAKGDAETARDIALAAANLKGNWSDLTGALNMPASVARNEKFWALTENLEDVTTAEPGVSAVWVEIVTGAGAGIGNAANGACQAVGRNPGVQGKIMMVMLVGMAMAESIAIYALVISLILLYANPFVSYFLG